MRLGAVLNELVRAAAGRGDGAEIRVDVLPRDQCPGAEPGQVIAIVYRPRFVVLQVAPIDPLPVGRGVDALLGTRREPSRSASTSASVQDHGWLSLGLCDQDD